MSHMMGLLECHFCVLVQSYVLLSSFSPLISRTLGLPVRANYRFSFPRALRVRVCMNSFTQCALCDLNPVRLMLALDDSFSLSMKFSFSPLPAFVFSDSEAAAKWMHILFGTSYCLRLSVCCSTPKIWCSHSASGSDLLNGGLSVVLEVFSLTASGGLSRNTCSFVLSTGVLRTH